MFTPGPWQVLIILVIAAALFRPWHWTLPRAETFVQLLGELRRRFSVNALLQILTTIGVVCAANVILGPEAAVGFAVVIFVAALFCL